MARSNKYASINFNEIYGPKKPTSSSSSSSSPSGPLSPSQNSPLSATRTHGRMLILTRPSKPQTPPPLTPPAPRPPPEKPPAPIPVPAEPDSTSLHPVGRTTIEVRESPALAPPKPEPFVPPHLRPGFAGREERPDQDGLRERQGFRPRDRGHQVQTRSGGGDDDNGRPKSGGGREAMRPDVERNRASSGGNRASSSGWNASSSRSFPPSSFNRV